MGQTCPRSWYFRIQRFEIQIFLSATIFLPDGKKWLENDQSALLLICKIQVDSLCQCGYTHLVGAQKYNKDPIPIILAY